MKRKCAFLLALLLLVSATTSCGGASEAVDNDRQEESEESIAEIRRKRRSSEERKAEEEATKGTEKAEETEKTETAKETEKAEETEDPVLKGLVVRKSPLKASAVSTVVDVTPSIAPYTVNADLSDVINADQFFFTDEIKQQLVTNGFSVNNIAGSEFFEIYETNRYNYIPNFVTVDSLMHTYHLYYSYLMKNLEKSSLSDSLLKLSRRMTENSISTYESAKGTVWEEAARECLLLFSVGSKLLDDTTQIYPDISADVQEEINRIVSAQGIAKSNITGREEDYSQYKVRGYYEGDPQLERYFRAMMMYGRAHFAFEEEASGNSALLMTEMIAEDPEAYALWGAIYDVTAFFVGASDDLGFDQCIPIFKNIYGEDVSLERILSDEESYIRFIEALNQFDPPSINSQPSDGGVGRTPGFRFMGQRFTIDAAVMQKLVHESVEGRMLPDVLDFPAALGSETALQILQDSGAANYRGYMEHMSELREELKTDNEQLWTASLYAGWLDTLRPLLEEKGDGYPMFMQNEQWTKKDLECFAGSFTELKHDTVLYTKQVLAEMGGIDPPARDDRGYVEPEPSVYARFAELADRTLQGLQEYGLLSDADRENLSRLSQMAVIMRDISVKELRDETLTDDEYEFIRGYGGSLEHFWIETTRDINGGNVSTIECPAALVVDVATGGGGILEMATRDPSAIEVVVKIDGQLRIAQGSVYSFYQFVSSERMTDSEWRELVRMSRADRESRNITKPDWTKSYRYQYEWE